MVTPEGPMDVKPSTPSIASVDSAPSPASASHAPQQSGSAPPSSSTGTGVLHAEPCVRCAKSQVPCEVRGESNHARGRACLRCHSRRVSCAFPGDAPRVKKPARPKKSSPSHPYNFPPHGGQATAAPPVQGSFLASDPASRPIAPLPTRPAASQHEDVLQRQLWAAQAATAAAVAAKDAIIAEKDAAVAMARAEAAAQYATAGKNSAAASYLDASHSALARLFTEPELRGEEDSVKLELMRNMWAAYGQSQMDILQGKAPGRDLVELLSPEEVACARRVVRESEQYSLMDAEGVLEEEDELLEDAPVPTHSPPPPLPQPLPQSVQA